MADAVINVRLTRKHFEDAKKKVKGSLDRDTLEASERQSWEMLYNQDQRTILENGVSALKRAELKGESETGTTELREAVFRRTKDWNEIKRLTHQVEQQLENPWCGPDKEKKRNERLQRRQ